LRLADALQQQHYRRLVVRELVQSLVQQLFDALEQLDVVLQGKKEKKSE
jgi:hypothetical protein